VWLDTQRLVLKINPVKIRNVVHRGLRRFIERNDSSGLAPATVEKVRNMMTFLQDIDDPQEMRDVPSWKAHLLTGNRKGTWSLSVTKNWRITVEIDKSKREIFDPNLEDYH
jgi:proteic killer suppression protein